MHDVHCVMQGKGGVGKSFVASMIAQWHHANNRPIAVFDTDPINQTSGNTPGLSATFIDLVEGNEINKRAIDGLIESAITTDGASVIDNGASSFLPVMQYLVANEISDILKENNRRLVLHSPVVDGGSALDTLKGLVTLLKNFPPDVPTVAWVNAYAGKYDADGYGFEETRAYQDNVSRISAIVHLHPLNPQLNGRDVAEMIAQRLTFEEAIASSDFTIVSKSRLHRVRRDIFEQLTHILDAI